MLGRVSSPMLGGADEATDEGAEEDATPLACVLLVGSGVLQTTQTAVPGGFVNPQCGHSVSDGMMGSIGNTIHDHLQRFKAVSSSALLQFAIPNPFV
ncbi:MAG: hypothetical protein ACRD8A_08140 [Candidatus Acidiferrales bacterium]